MRLSLKITVSIILVLAMALGLIGYLNYHKYRALLAELVSSRMEVLTVDLKETVESTLSLGLDIADMPAIQGAIEDVKAQDERILSVSVFALQGDVGDVVFTTEAMTGGAHPAWVSAQADAVSVWSLEDAEAFILGAPLIDPLDRVVGGVALRYSKEDQVARLEVVSAGLGRFILIVLAGGALAAALGAALILRPLSRDLRRLAAREPGAAEARDGETGDGETGDGETGDGDASLERRHTRFLAASRSAEHALAEAGERLGLSDPPGKAGT